MTVVVTETSEGGEETPTDPTPTEAAIEAVEVLAAARAEGVAEGLSDGVMIARLDTMQSRVDALEAQNTQLLGAIGVASEAIAAQSRAIDELNLRLAQEQEAHVEAVEEVVDETTEQEPEPVVDRTPARKRHWT